MRDTPASSQQKISAAAAAGQPVSIPDYLQRTYWWAYVHPRAVRVFERKWLVNLILFGNYARLRDRALAALGEDLSGQVLQVACVYGDLTPRLMARLAAAGKLDVVDVLPIQLANLATKIAPDSRLHLHCRDAADLGGGDARYDQVLLFFLLHEQPEAVRRRTLAEAWRVLKPGGRMVIVDYHRPHPAHPLYWPMKAVLRLLEPYALDLWRQEIPDFLPNQARPAEIHRQNFFGGLYQLLVLQR